MIDSAHPSIASPCVRNCCLDDKEMCLGCFRMMDEILIWGQANDQQKRNILVNCQGRKQQHKNLAKLKPLF